MSLFQRLTALKEKPGNSHSGGADAGESASLPVDVPAGLSAGLPAGLPEGREVKGSFGSCYLIERRYTGQVKLPCADPGYLAADLRLLRGIGPVTEAVLRNDGYLDIQALVNHPRWGAEACRVMQIINRRDVPGLRVRGAADGRWLTFFSSRDLVFLDIETLGLWSNQPLFLVGLLWEDHEGLVVRQFLARRIDEEKAVLEAVMAEVSRFRVVVTYNGKQFDVPYIEGRSVYHRMFDRFLHQQLDLLYHARRLLRERLPDCRLVTVEEHLLGEQRQDDIPGYLIPQVYLQYVRTQDPGIIRGILEHNALDILALARMLHMLVT